MSKDKLLVITAHPDDAELMFGGTINKYTRKGHIVDVLIITNGDSWNRRGIKDSKEIGDLRQRESKLSMRKLKVNEVSFLGMKDGFVNRRELQSFLISEIRKSNPNIILSHSELEGHPDHKEVSISVKRACNEFGEPAPIVNPYFDCKENPVSNFKGLFTHHFRDSAVNLSTKYISLEKIDIEKKIAAILCHKSQFTDEKKLDDRIFTEAHFNGLASGTDFAEVFDLVNINTSVAREMLID